MARIEWLYALLIKVENDSQLKCGLLRYWEVYAGPGLPVMYGNGWEGLGEWLESIKEQAAYIYTDDLTQLYQFFKTTYKIEEVFYIRNREVLFFKMGKAVFRSAALLSGEDAGLLVKQNLGVDAAGLPASEALWQAVKCEAGKRSVRSLPLTKTGYLRQKLKTAGNQQRAKELMDDNTLLKYLYFAFRGGNTVCNHWRMGAIIEDVHSWDITSAYLAAMYFCKYPIGKFERCKEPWQNMAWVAKVKIKGLLLKRYLEPAPYLAMGRRQKWDNPYTINGRVVGASEAIIYITDIDYKIIEKQYQWESFDFLDCYQSEYGFLPVDITDLVLDLFFDKEEAKATNAPDKEYRKSLANAIFGIGVQSPFTPMYEEYMPDPDTVSVRIARRTEAEQVAGYLDNMAVLPYQWGVWTSAHVRYWLQCEIERAGVDFIYADTDCVKAIGDYKPEPIAGLHEISYEMEGYKSILGGWREEQTASEFKMLGPKRYCAKIGDSLDLVLSGCQKEPATKQLIEKGGLSAFNPGLVLLSCGGIVRQYNDTCLGWQRIDGEVKYIPSNTYDTVCDYTIGQVATIKEMFSKQDFVLYAN